MEEFEDSEPPSRSVRLTFRYGDGEIELVERELLDMLDEPSDPPAGPEGESGFWVEVRDAEGRTVHRRVLADPFAQHVEVHSGEGERSRVPRANLNGTFIVDLPDLADGEQLVLFSSAPAGVLPARAEAGAERATEVARIALR